MCGVTADTTPLDPNAPELTKRQIAIIEFEGSWWTHPEGKEAAIFDRFYTERPQGEKFGTHSGLGLSISKQIVDAHHGTIRAENRLDAGGEVKGARFIVKLPVD